MVTPAPELLTLVRQAGSWVIELHCISFILGAFLERVQHSILPR